MAIDPPYRFDPFQNLINVHWPEETTAGTGGGPYIYRIWMDRHFGDIQYFWTSWPWPGHEEPPEQGYSGWASWDDVVASSPIWENIGGQYSSIFIDTMPLVMFIGTHYESRLDNYGWWKNIVTDEAAERPPSFGYSRVRIRDENIHAVMSFLNNSFIQGELVVYHGGGPGPYYIHLWPVSPFRWEKVSEISGVYARTSTNVIDSGSS